MKKGLKIFLFVVLGLFLIAVAGFMIKTDYAVERSIVIDAPKSKIVENVVDLQKAQAWSPWAEYDPNMKVSYEGTMGEVGSKSMWEGNEDVGKGYQEITMISDDKIEEKVVFQEPWEGESPVWFTFDKVDDGVKVSWGFSGESPILLSLFMDFEKMIGSDYEKGLSKLKAICEK